MNLNLSPEWARFKAKALEGGYERLIEILEFALASARIEHAKQEQARREAGVISIR